MKKRSKRQNFGFGRFFGFLKLAWFQLNYGLHVRVRYIHDHLYRTNCNYKNMSDKGYIRHARRATYFAFFMSFVIFTTAQWVLPSVFNFGRPDGAKAGVNGVTWDNDTQFAAANTNNDVNIDGTGNAATFRLKNDPSLSTGTGVDGDLTVNGATGAVISGSTNGEDQTISRAMNSSGNALVLDTEFTTNKRVWNFRNVTLTNGAYVTHSVMSGAISGVEGVEIYATTISVDSTSTINVSGKSTMREPASNGGGGGGYGGTGGSGVNAGRAAYGDANVAYMGSRGANGELGQPANGGFGGGRVKLSASTITLNGKIQANGGGGTGVLNQNGGGGGSGGGIYIAAASLTINDYLSAAGGGGASTTGLSGASGSLGTGGNGGNASLNGGSGGAPGIGGNGSNGSGNSFVAPSAGGPSAGGGGATNLGGKYGGGGGGAGRITIKYGTINSGTNSVPAGATTIEENDAAITKSGTWTNWTGVTSNITSPTTYSDNTYLSYTFTGKSKVTWVGTKNVDGGKADVTITNGGQTVDSASTDLYGYTAGGYCDGGAFNQEDCEAYEYNWIESQDPSPNLTLYTRDGLDRSATYTIKIQQRSDKNASSTGYRVSLDKFLTYDATVAGVGDLTSNSNKVGPYANYQQVSPYLTSGVLGDPTAPYADTGLQNNVGKKVKWNSVGVVGTIPAGTTVKLLGRFSDTLGSGNFVNPQNKLQSDTYSATIPAGTYTTGSPGLIDISSQNLTSNTIELYVKLEGGSATPTIDAVVANYDFLDTPANPKQYRQDTTTEIVSDGFTNETSAVLKADVSNMQNIPSETLTPEIELVTPSSASFSNPLTGSAVPGGVTYTPQNYDYVSGMAEAGVNFGTISGLTPGNSYKWQIRFTDTAGRVSSWSASNTFTIDQTGPTQPGSPTTTTPTTDTTPVWSWTASTDADSGINHYNVYWDTIAGGTTNTTTSASNSFTHSAPLADGTWYFKVEAVDNAGNIGAGSENGTVVIDTSAPSNTFSYNSGNNLTQSSTTIDLTFSATDTESGVVSNNFDLEYAEASLSNNTPGAFGSWTNVNTDNGDTSPVSFTGSTGKAYKFRVSAINNAGLRSTATEGSNWIGIDTTVPVTTFSYNSGSNLTQTSSTINLTFGGTDEESGVDANDFDLEYAEATLTNNVPGTFGAWTNAGSDNADLSPLDFTGTTGKAYKFRVSSKNNAGLRSGYTTGANWIAIDATAPNVNFSYNSGSNSTQNTATINLSFSATDAESGVVANNYDLEYAEANLSNNTPGAFGSWNNVDTDNSDSSPITFMGTTGKAYKFRVSALNNAGGRSNFAENSNWIAVDTTGPTATFEYNLNNSSAINAVQIDFSKTQEDDESGIADYDIEYQEVNLNYDNPSFVGATWNEVGVDGGDDISSFDGTTNKAYKFRYRVKNNAGSWSSYVTATNWIGVDTNLPAASSFQIDDGASATNDPDLMVDLAFTFTDVGSGLASYQIDNNDGNWSSIVDLTGSNGTYTGAFTDWQLLPGEGMKTVRVKLRDLAGNEVTNISAQIAYDITAPNFIHAVIARNGSNLAQILTENGTSQGWYPYNNPNFLVKADDGQSGIKEFKYCFYKAAASETCDYSENPAQAASHLADNTYQAAIAFSLDDVRQGVLTFKVKGVDHVGLESGESTYVYRFDKTLPGALLEFTASHGTEEGKVRLSWQDPFVNPTPRAPIEKFKIERIEARYYTPSLGYDGDWTGVTGYYYRDLHVVDDAAVLIKSGTTYTYDDLTMQDSLKYLYRVSAKDYSNSSFGALPADDPEFVEAGYGYTVDGSAPEVYPTSVSARACTGVNYCSEVNPALRGHQVEVKWLPAEDYGSGVAGYEIWRRIGGSANLEGWTLAGTLDETADALDVYRVFYDNTVADAKSYSYRIVAYDANPEEVGGANKTPLIIGTPPDPSDVTNATTQTADVPDVTAPTLPPSFNVSALGIDYIEDEEGYYHQKVSTSWKQTTDNNLNTQITYQLYFATVNTPESYSLLDAKNSAAFDSGSQNEADRISFKVDQTGLLDKTTYYYYVKVTDSANNTATTAIKTATTGNSAAPSTPTGVEVHNEVEQVTDPGSQLYVKFRGSLARNCDEVTKADCIVAYETYQAESNIAPDTYSSAADETEGTLTETTDDDCDTDEENADECWIRINEATLVNNQTVNPPAGNETLSAKRTFLATGLTQSTRYYFRVRAVDNNVDEALKSPLSTIVDDNIHGENSGGGWDITRDLTAPALPSGGLEVKVKDTHPNSSIMRNIISWKILDQTPLRKKLDYETEYNAGTNPNGCKIVVNNNIEYCDDFGRYEVYRQIIDSDGNVMTDTETPIAVISDPSENYYIDSLSVTETLAGGGLLIDAKIKYYVRVFDNSLTGFRYPDGTLINSAANKTSKQISADSIIPAQAKPSLIGSVELSDISVASAKVSWTTDQDTDSLVQYQLKNSGDQWITVGQVERTTTHSVTLFGLKPNTEYSYKLVSRNYLDNRVEYDENSVPALTTTGFTVTKGEISSTTTGAEINWTTNLDAASAFVEYQMNKLPGDEPQGKTVGVNPDELALKPKVHRVIIQGLKSNRTYTYKIKSISKDGYVAESEFSTFATKSFDTSQFTIAPSSSNVAERNITSTTAQIVWVTSSPGTSWVDYATKPGIKGQEKEGIKSAGSNELNTQHAVQIDGLVPGTKYYYIVRSKDANDIEYTSQEYSFTAILKPKISNLRVSDVKPYSITLEWDTNVDTETILNWGKTSGYGEKRGKNEITKLHKIVVDGLEDNTEYHYQILAKDETGNEVADEDKIVRTPLDTEGPQILNVKTDILPIGADDANASVIISWQTNKPATTLVEYDEGIIGGKYTQRSIEDKSLNLSHSVILKDLKPASSYHFKIVSKDRRGNAGQSPDHTFVTPSKEKSILQLILKSLEETFAWTRNMGQFFGNITKRATGK